MQPLQSSSLQFRLVESVWSKVYSETLIIHLSALAILLSQQQNELIPCYFNLDYEKPNQSVS